MQKYRSALCLSFKTLTNYKLNQTNVYSLFLKHILVGVLTLTRPLEAVCHNRKLSSLPPQNTTKLTDEDNIYTNIFMMYYLHYNTLFSLLWWSRDCYVTSWNQLVPRLLCILLYTQLHRFNTRCKVCPSEHCLLRQQLKYCSLNGGSFKWRHWLCQNTVVHNKVRQTTKVA